MHVKSTETNQCQTSGAGDSCVSGVVDSVAAITMRCRARTTIDHLVSRVRLAAVLTLCLSGTAFAQVARMGAWTTGTTHSVPVGSDRLLLFMTGYENFGFGGNADVGITNISYGGQNLTRIDGVSANANFPIRVELWYLDEARIVAASGTTFTVTYGGVTPGVLHFAAATYQGVDQASPVFESLTRSIDASTPNPIERTLNVTASGMAAAAVVAGASGTFSWGNGWAEGVDQIVSTSASSTADHPSIADGADTASATHTGPNRMVMVAVALSPSLCASDAECDDGNACTTDVCDNQGACQNTAVANGTVCNDGDACNVGETCQIGVCTGGGPASCVGTGGTCSTDSTCDPLGTEGNCDTAGSPLNEGLACDDADACLLGETCQSGVCAGGAPPDCTAFDDQCNVGVCDPVGIDGNCDLLSPANEGLVCNDGDVCLVGETCQTGVCLGGMPPDCTGTGDQCNADSTCDPGGLEGNCDIAGSTINEGLSCIDSDICNVGESCQLGLCLGGAPQDCSAAGDQCNTATCSTAGLEGNCDTLSPINEGVACDDGLMCSVMEVCTLGVCAGDTSACLSRQGPWTTGLSHTTTMGNNRLLMFMVGYEGSTDIGILSVTYGGQSLMRIDGGVAGSSIFNRMELWYLDEAGIAAATGIMFSVGYGGFPPANEHFAAASYENVDQTIPIAQSVVNTTEISTPNPLEAMLNVVEGTMSVAAVTTGTTGSYTWGNNWTEGTDQLIISSTSSSADHRSTAIGTDVASPTHTGPNRQVIVAVALTPVPIGCLFDIDCDDANSCTSDTCTAGSCSNVVTNEGLACDDGNACNFGETCQAGVCSGGAAPDCSMAGDQCNLASCDPGGAEGNCATLTPLVDGTMCDDMDVCNIGETCQLGVCTVGGPPDCSAFGDQCNVASCSLLGLEGNCDTVTQVPDGTACDDGAPCTDAVCATGVCVFSANAGQITVNVEADGLGNAVMRDVTFDITLCGGLVDTRVINVAFDMTGNASIVLSNVDANSQWLAVTEGHTLRRLSALAFTACAATVDNTGAGNLVAGDFQTGTVVQDNFVDITDFSVLASGFNTPIDPNLDSFGDITGDGLQGTADFAAMQLNFLTIGDAISACPFQLGWGRGDELTAIGDDGVMTGVLPMHAVPVSQLDFAGAEQADLNGDGWVDMEDIRIFARIYDLPLLPEFERQIDDAIPTKAVRTRR